MDQHHVPGQQHGPGDALPVPSQLGRLPGEATSLPDGLWPWLPVQLCLLPADGEFFFCQLTMRVKRDVVLALMKAVFLWVKVKCQYPRQAKLSCLPVSFITSLFGAKFVVYWCDIDQIIIT